MKLFSLLVVAVFALAACESKPLTEEPEKRDLKKKSETTQPQTAPKSKP